MSPLGALHLLLEQGSCGFKLFAVCDYVSENYAEGANKVGNFPTRYKVRLFLTCKKKNQQQFRAVEERKKKQNAKKTKCGVTYHRQGLTSLELLHHSSDSCVLLLTIW